MRNRHCEQANWCRMTSQLCLPDLSSVTGRSRLAGSLCWGRWSSPLTCVTDCVACLWQWRSCVRAGSAQIVRVVSIAGAHQILEHHIADAMSAHIAAEPFTPEVIEAGRIIVPAKSVQSRTRGCDGVRGEFKIGCRKHQFILNPVYDRSWSLTS